MFSSCFESNGCEVETVEGVSKEKAHPVQEAFMDDGAVRWFAFQGMIMSSKALLDENPKPSKKKSGSHIRQYLSLLQDMSRSKKLLRRLHRRLKKR